MSKTKVIDTQNSSLSNYFVITPLRADRGRRVGHTSLTNAMLRAVVMMP